MAREPQIKIKIQLLAEGNTEVNYFKSLRMKENLKISYKEVNVRGGGYLNFLRQIKKESDLGYLAKVILLDYDLARENGGEKKNFKTLLEYCIEKNRHGRIPYILIVNNYDFEYFACLHSSKYNNQDTSQFIIDTYKYKSIEDYKGDEGIYDKLNSNGNSYQHAINILNEQKKKTVISNDCELTEKRSIPIIKNKQIIYVPEADTYKNSNILDFLNLIL
ncbi:MAG TPA: hypothetical protein DCW90_02760 [Lachnospiraceae bacterium]|nr:RloB domain-containing protein [uncultured Lachnoclostridium sp.]HAU84452.1 hypothetical protein [Lachnospiraceae bacterium]